MTPLPLTSQLNMDSDPLGLRSMLSGDPGGVVSGNQLTPPSPSHSNSFLSSASSSQMFGGLIGAEFKPRQINKSASSNSLGKTMDTDGVPALVVLIGQLASCLCF